jgi:hypothetical protein
VDGRVVVDVGDPVARPIPRLLRVVGALRVQLDAEGLRTNRENGAEEKGGGTWSDVKTTAWARERPGLVSFFLSFFLSFFVSLLGGWFLYFFLGLKFYSLV